MLSHLHISLLLYDALEIYNFKIDCIQMNK